MRVHRKRHVSTRRRIESLVAVCAVVLSASLSLPGLGLAASPGPGPVGPESPLPSGATESPAASGAPEHGFATPEDAVQAYLAGIASNDFDAVLAACATQEMAQGYRFDLAAPYYSIIDFNNMWAPATNSFYQQINASLAQGQIARAVMYLSYSLLLADNPDFSDAVENGTIVTKVDEAKAQEFMSAVDPQKLSGLSIVEIRFPKASLENDPRLLKSDDAIAKIYSADERTERVALVALNGKDYVVGFTLLRYGSEWFVEYPTSALYGLGSTGIAMPTTQTEFEDQTSS